MTTEGNFVNEVEVAENVPVSAEQTAKPKTWGKPITKETAKQYALSAAKAKRLRKEARDKLLHGLVAEDIDMVAELKKAIRDNDETKIAILERAIKLVGLHYDQADENRVQNLNIKQSATVNTDNTLHVTIEEVKK